MAITDPTPKHGSIKLKQIGVTDATPELSNLIDEWILTHLDLVEDGDTQSINVIRFNDEFHLTHLPGLLKVEILSMGGSTGVTLSNESLTYLYLPTSREQLRNEVRNSEGFQLRNAIGTLEYYRKYGKS